MWDKIITAIYLSFTSIIIDALETIVLVNIFKDLYKEFLNYMKNKHGIFWLDLMREGGIQL